MSKEEGEAKSLDLLFWKDLGCFVFSLQTLGWLKAGRGKEGELLVAEMIFATYFLIYTETRTLCLLRLKLSSQVILLLGPGWGKAWIGGYGWVRAGVQKEAKGDPVPTMFLIVHWASPLLHSQEWICCLQITSSLAPSCVAVIWSMPALARPEYSQASEREKYIYIRPYKMGWVPQRCIQNGNYLCLKFTCRYRRQGRRQDLSLLLAGRLGASYSNGTSKTAWTQERGAEQWHTEAFFSGRSFLWNLRRRFVNINTGKMLCSNPNYHIPNILCLCYKFFFTHIAYLLLIAYFFKLPHYLHLF